eukprot:7097823-Heterocapsa_arctica.AAC.1
MGGLAEDRVAEGSAADAHGEALDDKLAHAERVPEADEMDDMDDKVREPRGMLLPTPPSAVELE